VVEERHANRIDLGRSVLVTGAGRGIGKGIARVFARVGAKF
jgi:NAD(P)-dependent dehydrogenase (short-subunit alcohol dehydrogenase family)